MAAYSKKTRLTARIVCWVMLNLPLSISGNAEMMVLGKLLGVTNPTD